MNAFVKPQIGDVFAKFRVLRCSPPYPKKLFETRDAFPLVVLDGGSFFCTQRHLGGGAVGP